MTANKDYKCDGCSKKLTFNEYYNNTVNLRFIKDIRTLCLDCGIKVKNFIDDLKKDGK